MLDVDLLMSGLAQTRPVFHSEADFQHAFAWRIREAMPDCQVRLEYNLFPDERRRTYLDIWLPGLEVAIELKYFTRQLEATHEEERFVLRGQGAQDIGRYDFLKDIRRVEQAVHKGQAKTGFAISLGNDPSYWESPSRSDTVDAAFRIHEGQVMTGNLAWSEKAGQGTIKRREEPITLQGSYSLRWNDYARLPQGIYAQFRYLAVTVQK